MSHAVTVCPRENTDPLPLAFVEFARWPAEALVQIQVVMLLFDCSKATAWRRIKQGIIPPPIKLAENSAVWQVGTLRDALARIAGAPAPASIDEGVHDGLADECGVEALVAGRSTSAPSILAGGTHR